MKRISSLLLPVIVPSLFLIFWATMAQRIGNDIVLPTVSNVAGLLVHPTENLISMGSLLDNVVVSLVRVLAGYILAAVLAIPIGIVMGYYRSVFRLLHSFLGIFRPIPPLAWVPLVLAWFGVASMATLLGIEEGQWYVYFNNLKFSMIFIIFIGAFYPILTNSIYGVSNVRKTLIDSAWVLGAGERDIFTKILLPASAPSIVNGLRVGLGVAWMCLVSAEMLPGSISGIGYLITHSYTVARTDIVIAGMASIGAVGMFMDYLFRLVENRCFRWQRLAR